MGKGGPLTAARLSSGMDDAGAPKGSKTDRPSMKQEEGVMRTRKGYSNNLGELPNGRPINLNIHGGQLRYYGYNDASNPRMPAR